MKKWMATVLALVLVLGLCSVSWAEEYDGFVKGEKGANGMDTYSVDVTSQEQLQAAVKATDCFGANMIINIKNDITITESWEPGYINGYGKSGKAGTGVVTVNGNGNKITGLSNMLFSGSWAGKCALIVKDLTIANANIKVEIDDTGVGAFLGSAGATTEVVFSNCHLVDSHVEGGHWTGGFVGYSAGYSGSDGPVFQTVKFTGCTVSGSTLTGKGSVGALIGHATGDAWTLVEVLDTSATVNEVTSTGSSGNKAGALFGTTGVAGTETNGKTGGIVVKAVVDGNTVQSNGTTVTTIYGRQGSPEGKLKLTGGHYDNMPIAESDASWAAPDGNLAMAEVTDESGKTIYNYGTDYIQTAATTEGVKTIIIKNGDVQLTGVSAGVNVKNDADGNTVTVNGSKNITKQDKEGYTVPQPEQKPSGNHYYYYAPSTDTTETKGSPKTFDAGVGIYAVTAVLSVTGMAWTAKKRED